MAFAQGSRSELRYIKQTSYGVTPASPTLKRLPIKTHSLDLTKERLTGADIQADRMQRVDRHGNRSASGSIEVDLRKGDFDEFLESAFMSTFDTNDVITTGTTPTFLALEDAALDVSEFRLFSGMTVSTATFSIAPNQMVNTTFEMVGQTMTQNATTASTGGAPTGPTSVQPFDSYNGGIFEGGTGTSDELGIVTSLEFSIANSFAPTFVVGSDFAPHLEYGMSVVEGTLTCYYEDSTLIDRFLNETETELQFEVDVPGGTAPYVFYMPRIKYNGASVPLANPQSRLITLPFVALYDSGEGTNLKLTRTS
jgi:hypothetical protein